MGAKPSGSRLSGADTAQGEGVPGLDLSIQNTSGLTFELFHIEPSELEPQVPRTIPAAADFRLVCPSGDVGLAFAAEISHSTARSAQAISTKMGTKTKKIDLRDGVTRQVLAVSIAGANLSDRRGQSPTLHVSLRTCAQLDGLFAGQPSIKGLQGTCSWEVQPERKIDGSFNISIKVAKTGGVVMAKRAALLDKLQNEAQKKQQISKEEAVGFLGSMPVWSVAAAPGGSAGQTPAAAGSSSDHKLLTQAASPVAAPAVLVKECGLKDDKILSQPAPSVAAPAALVKECDLKDAKMLSQPALSVAAPAVLVKECGLKEEQEQRETESRVQEPAAAPAAAPAPEALPAPPTRTAQLAQQVRRSIQLEKERRDEEKERPLREARERQVLRETQEAEFQESVLVDTVQEMQRTVDNLQAQAALLQTELQEAREIARRGRERLQRYGENPRLRGEVEAAEEKTRQLEEQLRPLAENLDELTLPLLEKQELLDVLRAAT